MGLAIEHVFGIMNAMATMKGGSISGGQGIQIPLDGNEYDNVSFDGVTFIYAATAPVTFTDCEFHKCKVDLRGIAKEKVGHMIATYEAEPKLIEGIYDSIRDGTAS